MSWWHWLLVHFLEETGSSSSNTRAYDWWSGFGSVFHPLLLIFAVGWWRRHACHTRWCWHWAHLDKEIDGAVHKVCHRCFGTKRPTREQVKAA